MFMELKFIYLFMRYLLFYLKKIENLKKTGNLTGNISFLVKSLIIN